MNILASPALIKLRFHKKYTNNVEYRKLKANSLYSSKGKKNKPNKEEKIIIMCKIVAPANVGIIKKFGVFLFTISKYEAKTPNNIPKGKKRYDGSITIPLMNRGILKQYLKIIMHKSSQFSYEV
jgi:hypothetical protein